MKYHQNLSSILARPIPNQELALRRKQNYRQYPLLKHASANNDPLVDISDYGIAGRSYYSRANSATKLPLNGVDAPIMIRKGLATKLADINLYLQQSKEVTSLLNGEVELFVQEGLRSLDVQRHLYEEVFPKLIHEQQPELSSEEVAQRRDELIAAPTSSSKGPSPHATGAALDITLRYVHPGLDYRQRSLVNLGHQDGATTHTAQPDYYERIGQLKGVQLKAQRNRRVFYWVMRGALLPSGDSGLVCNPTEWWHWSYGDQMWAALTEAPYAFYGSIESN